MNLMAFEPAQMKQLVSLARQAGKIAQDARATLKKELKTDGSIVSSADRMTEEFLRPKLEELVSGTKVYGEEFGNDGAGVGGQWAVDPIDGTSNFVYGSPLWGVSIGLIEQNVLTAGVVFLPDLNEMYSAILGRGAQCNGKDLAPVPDGPIGSVELLSYNDNLLRSFPGKIWPGKMRCSGAFVIDAMWVARQRFRGLVGVRGKLYDVAASVLINQEAGAEVTYIDGSPFVIENLMDGKTIPMPYTFLPKGAGPLLSKV